MRTLYILVWLSFLLVMTTGCIKEDLEDCDNVTIYFQYLADGDEDVLSKYISKIDLYVFDENECLVGKKTYESNELKGFKSVRSFRLSYGKQYKVVAVGNAFENTEVVNLEAKDLDNIYIQSAAYSKAETVSGYDENYIGGKTIIMPEAEGMMLRDTIIMKSAHISFDMRITGEGIVYPSKNGEQPFEVYMENANPQINMLNYVNTEAECVYLPELVYDEEEKCYHTDYAALYRLDNRGEIDRNTCSHILKVKNKLTGIDYSFSIYDYLNEHPEIKQKVLLQEAVLPLELHFSAASVEITAPHWDIEETIPEWAD